MRRTKKKRLWQIDPHRKGRGKVWVWMPPGTRRATGVEDEDKISVGEFLEVLARNADAICYRCKVRFKHHRGADHLFFEEPDEVPDEEFN